MAETRLVVDNREQLWALLVEAAQIEHMVICHRAWSLRCCRSAATPSPISCTWNGRSARTGWTRRSSSRPPPPQPVGQAEVMPRMQDFLTVGHLYRGIEQADWRQGRHRIDDLRASYDSGDTPASGADSAGRRRAVEARPLCSRYVADSGLPG